MPPNAIIYIPESYLLFHARATQSAQGRAVGELVNLSRHRRHTIIFDVQNPAHLDRNINSEADVVLVNEPGTLRCALMPNERFEDVQRGHRVGKGRKRAGICGSRGSKLVDAVRWIR